MFDFIGRFILLAISYALMWFGGAMYMYLHFPEAVRHLYTGF